MRMTRSSYELSKSRILSAGYNKEIESSKLAILNIAASEGDLTMDSLLEAEAQEIQNMPDNERAYKHVLLCKHSDFKSHRYRWSLFVSDPGEDYVLTYTLGKTEGVMYRRLTEENTQNTYDLQKWREYGFDVPTGVFLHEQHRVLKSAVGSWKYCELDPIDIQGIANRLGIVVEASKSIFDYEDMIVTSLFNTTNLIFL